jgi:hypothetical protein
MMEHYMTIEVVRLMRQLQLAVRGPITAASLNCILSSSFTVQVFLALLCSSIDT